MIVSLLLLVLVVAIAVALILVAFRAGRRSPSGRSAAAVHVSAAQVLETDEQLRRLGGLDVAEKKQEQRRQDALARSAAAARKPDGLG